MMDNLRDKKRIVGIKQSAKAVASGAAVAAFIAKDADMSIIEPFEKLCQAKSVPITFVESKKALGNACGIEVGASVAVIVKS